MSVHLWWKTPLVATPGRERSEHLAAYRALGVHRVMALVPGSVEDDGALEAFAADARAADAELA